MITAIANLANTYPAMKSNLERKWYNIGAVYMAEYALERIIFTQYEPITFHIPGGNYTPDFMHITESGRIYFVEVKGSRHQKGYRDARSKLRAAAEVFPWFTFIEARKENNAWELERIK